MSAETLSHGDAKATGAFVIGADVGASSLRAVGIAAAVRTGTGVLTLTLVDPIGADEFHALGALLGTTDGGISFARTADTTVIVRTYNTAGAAADRSGWFVISRLSADAAGLVSRAA